MTPNEILLICLTEECAEVAHRTTKLLRFGPEDIEPGHIESNRTRLETEIVDLLSVVQLLDEQGMIDMLGLEIPYALTKAKRKKIQKYLKYSQHIGICTVSEDRK